ncbi:DUF1570 domain-containing protein [Lignipirellula cremea]|uniref:Leucine Rich repeats (2 copies) n=1 Tax=Lignipirellula cremea TaxID=2528010 RepID=A0A518DTF4_9BACT|nr:DUF1570 domain-containing protein [Lignipirellula cremea]QDU95078.1 Leucine Rich repeats (2 copies) [Lignipirellula cremea]
MPAGLKTTTLLPGVRIAFLAGLLGAGCLLAHPSSAAEPSAAQAAVAEKRAKLTATYRSLLQQLAGICEQQGLPEQAQTTRDWFVERASDRQTLFLPDDQRLPEPPPGASAVVKSWHAKWLQYRTGYAEHLLALAKETLAAGDAATAYQMLHEVLRENPDEEQVRRMLGYSLVNHRWRQMGAAESSKVMRVRHPVFGWEPGRYWRVQTEHFQITTSHSIAAGEKFGQQLETLYEVWRQLFYLHWSSAAALDRQFAAPAPLTRSKTLFQVILFKDRQEYVQKLAAVPGIEVSQGYYDPRRRESLFYAGDDATMTTQYHEATHQLFQETGDTVEQVGGRDNFWLIEGVAIYMESLRFYAGYSTVGGFDAARMQFARYRRLNDGFYLPLEQLTALGSAELQRHEEIRKLYSQSAGLAHMLFDGQGGRYRQAAVDYLRMVYAGREKMQTLPSLTEQSFAQLDEQYRPFLNVTDEDLTTRLAPGESVRSLSLGHTDVTDAGLAAIGRLRQLDWLDLAVCQVTDESAPVLGKLTELTQLNLEGTAVTDRTLPALGRLRKLQILDLSGTKITDAGLSELAGLSLLEELWLTGTPVTDAGLVPLQRLRQLQTLQINGTRVTPGGYAEMKKALPGLQGD